jgi:transposase
MKIAIVGNYNYTNTSLVKDMLFGLKEKYGEELKIISTGNTHGIEFLVKQSSISLNIKYIEFPLYSCEYNSYCQENGKEYYLYNKNYSNKHKYIQLNDIVNFSDIIIIFENKKQKILDTYKKLAEKLNKKIIIM